ncbi:ERAD-associated protein [Phlyctochytrium bullatum]|nr:ERAD-associated protein [Phlyctochytrium bullatum]
MVVAIALAALCFRSAASALTTKPEAVAESVEAHHDLATSGPLTPVEDVSEIPNGQAAPLPPPGQDLVDRALLILEEVQNTTHFFDGSEQATTSSSGSSSNSNDAIARLFAALTERLLGPILPPQVFSALPFVEKVPGFSSGTDVQVDETWRFEHVGLEEAETLFLSDRKEPVAMRLARASRLLSLAGYEFQHQDALILLSEMNLALVYLNFAAMADDTLAEQALGYWYLTGIGVAKSCEDSVHFYRAVADKAINTYKQGPPFGLAMPPLKRRLSDEQGGVYGPGASGPGHQPSTQSAVSPQTMKEILEVQAEEGEVGIQIHLGRAYYDGTPPMERDYKKALRYFKMAVKAFKGPSVPTGNDIPPSLRQKITFSGIAAGYLGLMHWRGDGVPQNNLTARRFFERGQELDNGLSLAALGIMHLHGVAGLKKDLKKALEYFTAAAQKENSEAQVQMGEMNLKSSKPDAFTHAFRFYSAAAAKTPAHIMALYRLGEMYSKGIGTPVNCLMGVGYLKSVSERGDWNDDSLRRAERLARAGDYESALLHYVFAAERGIEVAQSNAAWLVDKGLVSQASLVRLFGKGVEGETVDPYDVAIVLWNRAANQGNVDGRVKVGDYYFYGLGVNAGPKRSPKEPSEDDGAKPAPPTVDGGEEKKQIADAPAEFSKAEEDAAAAEAAKKREQNAKEAAAAAGGSGWPSFAELPEILTNLTRLLAPLLPGAKPSKPDYKMAALYYQVASDEFSAHAQWNMGFMHENGLGVAKDYPLSKRMYDMAMATNPDAYLAANLALFQLFIKSSASAVSTFAVDLVTGRAFTNLALYASDLILSLLRTELGALAGDHADMVLPLLDDEEEAGPAGGIAGVAGGAAAAAGDGQNGGAPGGGVVDGLFDVRGPYGPLVKTMLRAWSGVWFELVLVSALAALASVLFLWRQLITTADNAARIAAQAAAVAAAANAQPPRQAQPPPPPAAGGAPPPAYTPTPTVPQTSSAAASAPAQTGPPASSGSTASETEKAVSPRQETERDGLRERTNASGEDEKDEN